ncbi:hypothetical protein [Vibrio sp. LaRot3]|uniref:hypothetical protein n=1 Tax=Vibrio sp. LaRot3 TaxID=2998829 RepID=UPI0022CE297C|nr:hypothetical protein [Vibrio sp. LaRot3]MDA0148457.1 hypothetical protein [Vibrio sp. LaRot3]
MMIPSLAACFFIFGLGKKLHLNNIEIITAIAFIVVLAMFASELALYALLGLFIAAPFAIRLRNLNLVHSLFWAALMLPSTATLAYTLV